MLNLDLNGSPVPIGATTADIAPDLPHDFSSVLISQMDQQGGFVRADQLARRASTAADPRRVMSYYGADTLPVSHRLAREYGVSDEWFASVPAGTWPNRLFMIAATSSGRVTNTVPALLYDVPTVFDRLGHGAWTIYNDQIPNVTLVRSMAAEWAVSRFGGGPFRSIGQFEDDCAAGALPFFSFIEPVYLGANADDAHPPHDITRSERFIARVYRAVRRSPSWGRTVLVITYDEHGGLFDHRPPPVPVPSTEPGEYGFTFGRLGVRVPCLIISPLVERGTVWRPGPGKFADHTSLVATVLRRDGLEPLTDRDAAAADLWSAFSLGTPRTDDGNTADGIEVWLAGQEAVATSETIGPLDPESLRSRSGREVATAIVAAAATSPTRAAPELETVSSMPTRALVPGDIPFEQALVELAQRIVALPRTEMAET